MAAREPRLLDAKSDGSQQSAIALLLSALAVTAIWGCNFVVIKVGTDHIPPLLLAALRFTLVLPALAFVERPRARWQLVTAYGTLLGVGEFGLLFTAIKLGAPTGLSSLILQSQAFFTAALAAIFAGQRIQRMSVIGITVAGSGLVLIGLGGNQPGAWGGHFWLALGMLIGAALMWAFANVLAQRIGNVGGLNLTVWSSLASPLPLLALSLLFEGPTAIGVALYSLSWLSVGALVYLVLLSTLFGYSYWNHLIVRHGVSQVAPFSMLVPIFGLSAGWLFLNESLSVRHVVGIALVLLGLALHTLGPRFRSRADRDLRIGVP